MREKYMKNMCELDTWNIFNSFLYCFNVVTNCTYENTNLQQSTCSRDATVMLL